MRNRRWFGDLPWVHYFTRRQTTWYQHTSNATDHPARIFTVTNKGGTPTDPPLTHGDTLSHG
jgi:hypothetical protein